MQATRCSFPESKASSRPHDQAHLLRREPEAVPGPVRPHRGLRPLRRRVRDHAGRADPQAPDLPDSRRLVSLQPRREPGPDVAGHPQPYQVADEARTHELEPELQRRQAPRLSPWSARTQDHRQTTAERRFRPFPISDDSGPEPLKTSHIARPAAPGVKTPENPQGRYRGDHSKRPGHRPGSSRQVLTPGQSNRPLLLSSCRIDRPTG